jgi:hypothetical protein
MQRNVRNTQEGEQSGISMDMAVTVETTIGTIRLLNKLNHYGKE